MRGSPCCAALQCVAAAPHCSLLCSVLCCFTTSATPSCPFSPTTHPLIPTQKGTREETVALAQIIEHCHVDALAVHGRFVSQRPRDPAHWGEIAAVVSAVSVPVIANGDVFKVEDWERIREATGAASVMCARGAMWCGNTPGKADNNRAAGFFRIARAALRSSDLLLPGASAEQSGLCRCACLVASLCSLSLCRNPSIFRKEGLLPLACSHLAPALLPLPLPVQHEQCPQYQHLHPYLPGAATCTLPTQSLLLELLITWRSRCGACLPSTPQAEVRRAYVEKAIIAGNGAARAGPLPPPNAPPNAPLEHTASLFTLSARVLSARFASSRRGVPSPFPLSRRATPSFVSARCSFRT